MKDKIKLIIDTRPLTDDENTYHYFYIIRNKINGKEYYGIHSTKDLNDGYSGSGSALNAAKKKYGIDCFYMQILAFFKSRQELSNKEKSTITLEYLELHKDQTYNLVTSGDNGHYLTDIVKEKISKTETGKIVSNEARIKNGLAHKGLIPWNKGLSGNDNPQVGIKRTQLTCQRISIGLSNFYLHNQSHLKGKKRDKSFCKKVSIGKKGKKFSENHKKNLSLSHKGLKHSDSTKIKISESSKNNPRGFSIPKKVYCKELDTTYTSAKTAWNKLKNIKIFINYQNFCKKIRLGVTINNLTFYYV